MLPARGDVIVGNVLDPTREGRLHLRARVVVIVARFCVACVEGRWRAADRIVPTGSISRRDERSQKIRYQVHTPYAASQQRTKDDDAA